MNVRLAEKVLYALRNGEPLVALETAVLTHGLPYPYNLQAAYEMEKAVEQSGAVACTIGMLRGELIIGLSGEEIKCLAETEDTVKISRHELPCAMAKSLSGGTTVSAAAYLAYRYGIRVFATGGIGGVHRDFHRSFDISADLAVLAKTPLIVVASGAKAILDLRFTLEYLETAGIAVLGYNTEYFPAFYSSRSPYIIPWRINSAEEAARAAAARDSLGLDSALLVCNPVPEEYQIPYEELMPLVDAAVEKTAGKGIAGKDVTPYMLKELAELSQGRTLKANLALLAANARLGGEIACRL